MDWGQCICIHTFSCLSIEKVGDQSQLGPFRAKYLGTPLTSQSWIDVILFSIQEPVWDNYGVNRVRTPQGDFFPGFYPQFPVYFRILKHNPHFDSSPMFSIFSTCSMRKQCNQEHIALSDVLLRNTLQSLSIPATYLKLQILYLVLYSLKCWWIFFRLELSFLN
jgi:hypothetical protein